VRRSRQLTFKLRGIALKRLRNHRAWIGRKTLRIGALTRGFKALMQRQGDSNRERFCGGGFLWNQ